MEEREPLPKIPLSEVKRHQSRNDCWVVIHGYVYDITNWGPKHPGGDVIYTNAGKDSTLLFDSYHGPGAWKVLEKYCIGELEREPGDELEIVSFQEEGDFYDEVKRRVRAYFRQKGIEPRVSRELQWKAFLILLFLALTYWLAFLSRLNFPSALFLSALCGFWKGEVGVSIQHDANHGAFSRRKWVCTLMGATLDLLGASSFYWQQQHVCGHHTYTNVVGEDPDIRVSSKDIRRPAPNHPWHPIHKYQHIYLGLLYGLLVVKSVFLDDFVALCTGRIGNVKVKRMDLREHALFWFGKSAYAALFIAMPCLWSPHSYAQIGVLWLTCELVTGYMLAFLFQVAHVVHDVGFFERDAKGQISTPWAVSQLCTTADFSHGSWFWLHLSGGLNYQVVHHLFPGVAHPHYPAIAPIVKNTALEYGVPYTAYESFAEALSKHFEHLRRVGNDVRVPSFHSIG